MIRLLQERNGKMFLKILKKDLKRSKTMNIILFLFIILATIFVSSGLNNLISVMNGMNYFVDQATENKDDYFMIVDTGKDNSKVRNILDDSKAVKSYGVDRVFNYTEYVKDENGKKFEWNGMVIIESPESTQMHFYDKENQEINKVEKGHIFLSKKFMKKLMFIKIL